MATRKTEPTAAQPARDTAQRKPWKKKTPVEVVLEQINKLRDEAAQKEEDLKQARRQLQKLEEVRKLLETN